MLWGNIDYDTSNLKPLFANTTNLTSNSTTHGSTANTDAGYGRVVGVSTLEQERSNGAAQHPVHAGWVSMKIGTGPIVSISTTGSIGVNSGGYMIISDGSVHRRGTGANISYSIANTLNTMEAYSTNAHWNVVNSFTIVNGGSGYSNATAITALTNGTAMTNGTFSIVLGGRAGRITTETLVAMGSISGDDLSDNSYFTGV